MLADRREGNPNVFKANAYNTTCTIKFRTRANVTFGSSPCLIEKSSQTIVGLNLKNYYTLNHNLLTQRTVQLNNSIQK